MRIFNELRYPSSNLSEIFTQRMFQASFEKIWKIFFELSRGQAWSYGRTDRQTDRQTDGRTDRQTDRRTEAGNDNTPPALGPRGKNWNNLFRKMLFFGMVQVLNLYTPNPGMIVIATWSISDKTFTSFMSLEWSYSSRSHNWLGK